MKTITILAAALVCALALTNAHAQEFAPEQLQQRTLERRAVEAAIWGMPIVNMDAMRQAYFRSAGAKYGDVVFLPWFRTGSCSSQHRTTSFGTFAQLNRSAIRQGASF